jgi:hypothetical protein
MDVFARRGSATPSDRAPTLSAVIPEGDHAPRSDPPREGERDTLAERRARRAWLGDAAALRRAEAAETTVRTLETHLADLRRRQVAAEHERESATALLAERDLQLRRVKQREYAEQQLRVEAEEAAVRMRRAHRAGLDRLQRRAEAARAAAQHAEEQRDILAARLAGVSESCARLQHSIATLHHTAAGLRTALEQDRRADRARIRELEGELERALAPPVAPTGGTGSLSAIEEALRREEMVGALASAVGRLRARVAAPVDAAAEGTAVADVVGGTAAAGAVEEPAVAGVVVEPAAGAVEEPAVAGVVVEPAAAGAAEEPAAPPREIPTVYVVPRLFPSRGGHAPRLAPVLRRVAARLVVWADRAQDRPR